MRPKSVRAAVAASAAALLLGWAYRHDVHEADSQCARHYARPAHAGSVIDAFAPMFVDPTRTDGWHVLGATAALSHVRAPLPYSCAALDAARIATALSVHARQLAEGGHAREATEAFEAALVVDASLLASGAASPGARQLVRDLGAMDLLRLSLDAETLRGFRDFAWPSASSASSVASQVAEADAAIAHFERTLRTLQ